jgi:hypothetical protein
VKHVREGNALAVMQKHRDFCDVTALMKSQNDLALHAVIDWCESGLVG